MSLAKAINKLAIELSEKGDEHALSKQEKVTCVIELCNLAVAALEALPKIAHELSRRNQIEIAKEQQAATNVSPDGPYGWGAKDIL